MYRLIYKRQSVFVSADGIAQYDTCIDAIQHGMTVIQTESETEREKKKQSKMKCLMFEC